MLDFANKEQAESRANIDKLIKEGAEARLHDERAMRDLKNVKERLEAQLERRDETIATLRSVIQCNIEDKQLLLKAPSQARLSALQVELNSARRALREKIDSLKELQHDWNMVHREKVALQTNAKNLTDVEKEMLFHSCYLCGDRKRKLRVCCICTDCVAEQAQTERALKKVVQTWKDGKKATGAVFHAIKEAAACVTDSDREEEILQEELEEAEGGEEVMPATEAASAEAEQEQEQEDDSAPQERPMTRRKLDLQPVPGVQAPYLTPTPHQIPDLD